jgi:hypothetical protein
MRERNADRRESINERAVGVEDYQAVRASIHSETQAKRTLQGKRRQN